MNENDVKLTAEQVLASRTPEATQRLKQVPEPSESELMQQSLADVDNPPWTARQLAQIERDEPVTQDPAGLLLLHLEYSNPTEQELAELIGKAADLLQRRMAKHDDRKAG